MLPPFPPPIHRKLRQRHDRTKTFYKASQSDCQRNTTTTPAEGEWGRSD
ncbi:hypothetical protein CGRA01v4_00383 [Colletotrichum graminicola]|nr:hypothetical protein CGRA01v4_00383 [Colletotrichum graminicola]